MKFHWEKYLTGIAFALLLVVFCVDLVDSTGSWESVEGYENARIARNLEEGHGYSFHASRRWLFERGVGDGYRATAWIEPVYPTILAGLIRIFDEKASLSMLLLHDLAFFITGLLVFAIASHLKGRTTGAVALLLYLGTLKYQQYRTPPIESVHYLLSNGAFGGLVVAISALMLIIAIKKLSLHTMVITGIVLGITNLTYAATSLFMPTSLLLVMLTRVKLRSRICFCTAIASSFFLILSPWMIRNYLEFGHLVPVRNGAGQILHAGNPSLAATYSPAIAAQAEALPIPWQASDASDAILKVKNHKNRRDLERYQQKFVESMAPPGYEQLNEAERDAVYKKQAFDFIQSNPTLFIELSTQKALAFIFTNWKAPGALALLALLGMLTTRWDPGTRALIALVSAYCLPYLLTLPYFYRYRYPIDPLLAILASFFICWLFEHMLKTRIAKRSIE